MATTIPISCATLAACMFAYIVSSCPYSHAEERAVRSPAGKCILQRAAESSEKAVVLHEEGSAQLGVRAQGSTQAVLEANMDLETHGNIFSLAINKGEIVRATGAVKQDGRVLLRKLSASVKQNPSDGAAVASDK